MRIGIDISQVAFNANGVSNYLVNLIENILKIDDKNEYVLFFSSMRRSISSSSLKIDGNSKVKIKKYRIPPTILDLLWNRLHIFPIEWFIGQVDLFITSDWTEPPSKAKKATIIYDLIVYKSPNETASRIVQTQKRKLKWVKKESDLVFAISESTKRDIEEILKIDKDKIRVIYPSI